MQYSGVDFYDGAHSAGMINTKLRFRAYIHLVLKDKVAPILSTSSLQTALDVLGVLNKDEPNKYTIYSKEK